MTDFIREIEEDLRADRARMLWQRYGKLAIALLVALVLGTAAFVAWRDHQRAQLEAEGDKLAAALALIEKGDTDGAVAALGVVANDPNPGYAALAELNAAALLLEQGKLDQALASYDRIAARTDFDPLMRDLAVLLAGYQRIATESPEQLRARLSPVLQPNNTWRFAAREIVALTAIRSGQTDAARTELAALADDAGAPSGIRGRASELLAALGGK